MDNNELDAIEARAAKATAGPWELGTIYISGRYVRTGNEIAPNLYASPTERTAIGDCFNCPHKGREWIVRIENGQTVHREYERDDDETRWRVVTSRTTGDPICDNYDYDSGGVASKQEDAEFISNARTDIPALIAEVRRLRGAIDGALAAWPKENGTLVTEVITSWADDVVRPSADTSVDFSRLLTILQEAAK